MQLRLLAPMVAVAIVVAIGGRVLLPDAGDTGLALLTAAGIGLVLALALSWVAARRLSRAAGELRAVADAIADGDLGRAPRRTRTGDLDELADSLDRMGAALRVRLSEATAEKERLEAVLASMVEGVLVLDANGRMVLANPRLRELLGAWGEVAGKHPLEAIRNAEIDAALREAAESEGVVARELERVGVEGRTLLMHATAFPASGPRAGTVAVFHDVSEIRRLEEVRRDFIANASHELRTPLTSIRGFADTLLSGPLAQDDLHGALEAIDRNARRLDALIEDLLELSRIESRKVPLRPSEVDVSRVCRVLAEDAEPRLRKARLAIDLDLTPGVQAWADQRAVEQVVGNLLDNAIKYTDAGGRIRVRAAAIGGSVEIVVEDSGLGIPEADRRRIFERFYRVDKARSRALGGTGLGLAIVKHLVQASGGDISVESEPGKGSRFTVSLPQAR